MAISEVVFGAFSLKHLYLVEVGASSSDVMTEAVKRLTGRAALRIGIKKVTKSGVVKYTDDFDPAVVEENRATYRSGTTINGIIALTQDAMDVWFEKIILDANASASDEFHSQHDIVESAGITIELDDKKDFGSKLNLSGGYSVRANVLFKKDGITATAVHLENMEILKHDIDSDALEQQSAVLTSSFLSALSSV